MAKEVRIVQISPAPEFLALYRTPSPPYFELRRLLAIALLENETGKRWVSGLDERSYLCSQTDGFTEYAHSSSVTPEQREAWQKQFKP
jgi:hypothetical protein